MTKITELVKPWEMGELKPQAGIPPVTTGEFLLVRLVPPKDKLTGEAGSVRNGLVASFMMLNYTDDTGTTVETVKYGESPEGFKFEFPLGKRDLLATKFRGPKNLYRFFNLDTKSFYEIQKEKFTPEYAEMHLAEKFDTWDTFTAEHKDELIDEYLQEMFMFGLSQDLILPIKDGNFTAPFVGMSTKLYRIYTPPMDGERWGRTIITKFHKGSPRLDDSYNTMSEQLATAMLTEYKTKEDKAAEFDPTTFTETEDDVV